MLFKIHPLQYRPTVLKNPQATTHTPTDISIQYAGDSIHTNPAKVFRDLKAPGFNESVRKINLTIPILYYIFHYFIIIFILVSSGVSSKYTQLWQTKTMTVMGSKNIEKRWLEPGSSSCPPRGPRPSKDLRIRDRRRLRPQAGVGILQEVPHAVFALAGRTFSRGEEVSCPDRRCGAGCLKLQQHGGFRTVDQLKWGVFAP